MRLAVNYSPEVEDLLARGRIEVDLLKCPDWPDAVEAVKTLGPVYVHFSIAAGNGTAGTVDLDQVEQLRDASETPFVNTHLKPRLDGRGHVAALRRTIEDIRQLTDRFGPEVVIAENVPSWGDGDDGLARLGAQPPFIRRVLEETGTGLLLDIAHARIAAHALDVDIRDYLARLPGERLRELHVTGIGRHNGSLRDHLPMHQADWMATEWCIERIADGDWARPEIVALEYGGIGNVMRWRSDADVLAREVPRLYSLTRRLIPLAPTG